MFGRERQEFKVISAEALVAMPEHLNFEAAANASRRGRAGLVGAGRGGTGRYRIDPGTGGVSLFALQLAKASGALVIARTSSVEKAERLRSLGADHVIDYRASPECGDGSIDFMTMFMRQATVQPIAVGTITFLRASTQ